MIGRHLIVLEDLAGVPLPDDNDAPREHDATRHGVADATNAIVGWPELDALEQRDAPPRFPTDALPTVLRDYVEAVAAATETPRDWGGMLSLAAVASVAQQHYAVDIPGKLHADPIGLGVGIVSPPATRKSEIFRAFSEPLVDIELARQNAWEEERQASTEEMVRKPRPRILHDDGGPEWLTTALAEQGGHAAVWSPEGSALAHACGRYSKGSGPKRVEVYLQAMAGDRVISDRCGPDGRHAHVRNPALTYAATLQPHVLDQIVSDSELRGRGFVGRIVWVLAPHGLGERVLVGLPAVKPELQRAYAEVLARLGEQPFDRDDERVRVRLGDAARAVYFDMLLEREPKLADGGELELLREWAGKLESLFCRIAGLAALVEGLREVDERNARRARAICRWALAHAKLALAAPIDPAVERVNVLQRWTSTRERFSKHEAHEALKGRDMFKTAETLDAPLRELVERGYIRRLGRRVQRGRPSALYEVRR